MGQQMNQVEVQGNNLYFPLLTTKRNANYSPKSRLGCFVLPQLETSLLITSGAPFLLKYEARVYIDSFY